MRRQHGGETGYPTEPMIILPPIISPSSTGGALKKHLSSSAIGNTRNSSHGNTKHGAEEWQDLPGQLASLWGRKLPSVGLKGLRPQPKSPPRQVPHGAAEALGTVEAHLSDVQTAQNRRNPTLLDEALKEAQGTGHLKAVQRMRKSRSTSDMHKHALESALATHLVKAKATLAKWKLGQQEIQDARRLRDIDAIEDRLDHWKFDEREPAVRAAREDLKTFAEVAKKMPRVLREGVESRDIKSLRSAVKELATSYPRAAMESLPNYSEARVLISQYEAQEKAMKSAVELRSSKELDELVQSWNFNREDPLYFAACTLLDTRDQLRVELQNQVDADPPSGPNLRMVVDAWDFDKDAAEPDETYTHAKEILARFDEANSELADLVAICVASPAVPASFAEIHGVSSRPSKVKKTADLNLLRNKVDAWKFVDGPQSGCPALQEAVDLLQCFEDEIQEAVDVADGWRLHRMWTLLGTSLPLAGKPYALQVIELLEERTKAAEVLRTTLADALTAEPNSVEHLAEVKRCVATWDLDESDPVMRYATSWLVMLKNTGDRSAAELVAATDVGSAVAACGALNRRQGLDDNDEFVKDAVAVVEAAGKAHRMAAWLAFGTPPEDLVEPEADNSSGPSLPWPVARSLPELEEARSAAHAAMSGNKLAVAMWKAANGSVDALQESARKAMGFQHIAQQTLQSYRSKVQALLDPPLDEGIDEDEVVLPDEGLLRRAERCMIDLTELTKSSPKKVGPLGGAALEAAYYLVANTTKRPDNIGARDLVAEMIRALEVVGGVLFDVYEVMQKGESANRGLPETLRGLGRERPLVCCSAEPPSQDKLQWNLQPAVPLESISHSVRVAGTAHADCRGLAEVTEFISVIQSYYEDFLPVYSGLSASATAVEDAVMITAAARAAMQMSQDSKFAIGDVINDVVFPALVVNKAEREAAEATAELLETAPTADASSKARLAWTRSALDSGIRHVRQLGEELAVIAEGLDIDAIIARVSQNDAEASSSNFVALLNAALVASLSTTNDGAHPTFDGINGKTLSDALKAWSPLSIEDAALECLMTAGPQLLCLWDWYTEGCDGCPHACALFAWVTLAVALLPVLPSARSLSPSFAAVNASFEKLDGDGSDKQADASWHDARKALHRKETPWWWLKLLGCEDAQQFYENHGFALESKAAVAPNAPKADADGDTGEYSADGFAAVSPDGNQAADAKAADDGYGFEDDREQPSPAKEDRDDYVFEGEEADAGEPKANTSAASAADPGSPSDGFGNDTFEEDTFEQSNVEETPKEALPDDSVAKAEDVDCLDSHVEATQDDGVANAESKDQAEASASATFAEESNASLG